MNKYLCLPLYALLLVLPGNCVLQAEDIRIEAGFRAATAIGKATRDQDATAVAAFTHPRVMELVGGRDAMIAAADATFNEMREQGITLRVFSVKKATAHGRSSKNLFSVFPTETVIDAGDQSVTAKSYLLGVSDDAGKTWKFFDGSGLADEKARKLLVPDLPESLKLPSYSESQNTK